MAEDNQDQRDEFSEQLDFSSVIASSVHDMKNSIAMLMSSLDEMIDELPDPTERQDKLISTLQYEASRVNNDLIHLLSFYRLKKNNLPITLDEHFVFDVLEEQIAYNKMLAEKRGIKVSLHCDSELVAYFDAEMVSGILNNILINSIRYSNKSIEVSASEVEGFVKVSVSDDGCGFPDKMLVKPGSYFNSVDFTTGSTGLGLYFAGQIASLHKHDGREGYIELSNGGSLGGGVFSLYIP